MRETEARMQRRPGHAFLGVLFAIVTALAPVHSQTQAHDPWITVESTGAGKTFIGKILNREPVAIERASQTRLLRITWAYAPATNGFPSEQDLGHIAQIEDGLADALGEGVRSKLVMSETGNGGRLWLFYVSENVDVEDAIRRVSLQQRARLAFSTVNDPAWNYLRDARSRVK